ncbi:MAG: DUF3320 domain-containing protein [Christensenellales bacterium]
MLKSLKPLCKNPSALQKKNVPTILNTIASYKQSAKFVEDNSKMFGELFGLAWNNGSADFDQIGAIYQQALELNERLLAASGSIEEKVKADNALAWSYFTNAAAFRQLYSQQYEQYLNLIAQVTAAEQNLSASTNCNLETFSTGDNWLSNMIEATQGWLSNIDDLRDWCIYLSTKQQADAIGLGSAAEALERGAATEENVLAAFEKALHMHAAEAIIAKEPALQDFSGTLMETNVKHYRDVCSNFEQLTRNELLAKLSSKVPMSNINVADSSEISILKRAIRSGGRGLSIRKLFDMISNLLPRLCSCLLMSPISVAQYIDPSYPQFDLVIFDEASQLPTSEAVGAIARGKNLIVVGDPKQLPPTSFFTKNRTDDDNFEQEDLESILDDCLALSIPETYLQWHYRSRHESLIAFSNREFYNNELFTFPSPNALVSEVVFVPVQGFYDRSKTRQNEAEANAVVVEIIRRLSHEQTRNQSIGVVTFSVVQQNLIDDKLQAAFAKHPQLDEWNSNASEPVFIKNLENVQGDERDVVLFSIGYGPDSAGKVTLNFGPLNRAGGWRRLNVAVSRARQKMIVYSTLSPEQIDLSKTRAEGVVGLRAFLEFAKNGKQALHTRDIVAVDDINAIITNIAEALRKEGYKVNTNIGYSRYRVDLGVVHPDRPQEYILGILLDGERYRNAATARDRNILQDSVLASLGWKIHHVYVIDWLQNSGKEIQKLIMAIKNSLASTPELTQLNSEVSEPVPEARYERLETHSVPPMNHYYTVCNLTPVPHSAEAFYLMENARLIMEQMEEVIEQEAPISSALLTKRIINAWSMTRTGKRINAYMEYFCNRMALRSTRTIDTVFFWNSSQQPEQYDQFRTPENEENRRNMDNICKEEISSAVKHVLENQVSLTQQDLRREVYKLFGFSRIGQNMETYINEGIRYAVQRGFAFEENGRIVLK